jgi:hypothetical protein
MPGKRLNGKSDLKKTHLQTNSTVHYGKAVHDRGEKGKLKRKHC